MTPATERQLAKLRELNVFHDHDISKEDAAEILRQHLKPVPRVIDPVRIKASLAVESEGDPLPGSPR